MIQYQGKLYNGAGTTVRLLYDKKFTVSVSEGADGCVRGLRFPGARYARVVRFERISQTMFLITRLNEDIRKTASFMGE